MSILQTQSDVTEVCVKNVLSLRDVASNGRERYKQTFQGFNAAMAETFAQGGY